MNEQRVFPPEVVEKIGEYIYALRDPRDKKVFYIGKGNGDRIFHHFNEADAVVAGTLKPSSKLRRILEIWETEEDVEWFVVRRNLQSCPTAFDVEAAIIDTLSISQNGPALNEVSGHGAANRGVLDADQVAALAVQKVNPIQPYPTVFIFPIHGALQEGFQLYEATRGWWTVNEALRREQPSLAVGVVNGISRTAFSITAWEKEAVKGKWQFVGTELTNELLNKNWANVIRPSIGYWQRGNFIVVEFNGLGGFRFKRGNAAKDCWREL